MLLTLYKDTILNDRYATVFDCDETYWGGPSNTPLMKYLSLQFKKYFDLPTVYMKESGTISVDIALPQTYDIFEYNYMSLESDDLGKRYYFIDNIELGNGIVQLTYTLDIWHTYSGKMRLNNAVIGRAYRNTDELKRALPVAYETNQPTVFSGSEDEFYLVAEMSEYVLSSSAADATIRRNFTAFLGYQPEYVETMAASETESRVVPINALANNNQTRLFTIDTAEKIVHLLTQYQGVAPQRKGVNYRDILSSQISVSEYRRFDTFLMYSREFDAGNNQPAREDTRYEINQIYAIPKEMFDESNINTATNQYLELGLKFLLTNNINPNNDSQYQYRFQDVAFYRFKDNFDGIDIEQQTIDADALTVGYGLRNMTIPLPYNNLDYTIQSIVQINDLGFSICFLTPEEGYIDLNPMFEVPLPFTTPSGVERQQQAIAKQQAKIQLASAVATTIASLGTRVAGGFFSVKAAGTHAASQAVTEASNWSPDYLNTVASVAGTTPAGFITDFALSRAKTARASAAINAVSGSAMTGLYAMQHIMSAINQLKSPLSTGQPNNTTPNALANAAYGFGIYTIVPNNAVEVTDSVSKIGYSVYLPLNDYHHGITKEEACTHVYDIVQFLNAEVNGPFSQIIARTLEGILMAGFKIVYDA